MNVPQVLKVSGEKNAAAPPKLLRAQGRLHVAFKKNLDQRTVLDELYQQGCLKARFPSIEPDQICEAVLINTSGGLTDGDRLEQRVDWGKGTTACVTAQAAERIYRSRRTDAHINTRLTIGKNAHAQWLPQETILFNGGRLHRSNNIDMQKYASLLATESLVFGRTAMNETVTKGSLFESWRIRYDGKLIFADGFHLHGNINDQLKNPAIAAGSKAIATLLYVGEGAPSIEKVMKNACKDLSNDKLKTGYSLLSNLLVIRILGADGAMMRSALSTLTKELMSNTCKTGKTDLPKVWQC